METNETSANKEVYESALKKYHDNHQREIQSSIGEIFKNAKSNSSALFRMIASSRSP